MVFAMVLAMVVIGASHNLAAQEDLQVESLNTLKKQLKEEVAGIEEIYKESEEKYNQNNIKLAVVFCRTAELAMKEQDHKKAVKYYKMALILCPIYERARTGLVTAQKAIKKPETLSEYMRFEGIERQRDLAVRLGVSESAVSRFLNGTTSFSRQSALRINKITGIPIRHLITLQEPRQ